MTLDVGSNVIHGGHYPVNDSIFVNGNLARVLMASSKIFQEPRYLAEGLRWCDTFVSQMVDVETSTGQSGGWWDTGYQQLYIADTGTAVTALAVGYYLADTAARKSIYQGRTQCRCRAKQFDVYLEIE